MGGLVYEADLRPRKEMRNMLVEKTSPGLGVLVNRCKSLTMPQKRDRF